MAQIPLESVTFVQPTPILGKLPVTVVHGLKTGDGWVLTLDTGSADEVACEKPAGHDDKVALKFAVPRSAVLAYKRAAAG